MAEQAAEKKERKAPSFKCAKCGKSFAGGRALGTHYSENPDHRPAGKSPRKAKRGGRKPGRKAAGGSFAAAIANLDAKIAELQDIRARLAALE